MPTEGRATTMATDSPAGLQLDPSAAQPAPAVPRPARDRDGRAGPSGLIAWLLVATAAVGMLASTPASAGPDEPTQEATAWYMSGNGLPPGSTVSFAVPASLLADPCFQHQPDETAACMASRSTNRGLVMTSNITNYPPPYYWFVGAGERLAALVGNEYADIGGRLASFILNFGSLLLLSLHLRRRRPMWGNYLLLVSTPLAVFLGVVVNPSGWEITCGTVMAVALGEAAWSGRPNEEDARPWTGLAFLVLASLALSTARPLGFLWASGLTLSAIALAPKIPRRMELGRAISAVAPGIILGLLWFLTHPTLSPATTVTSPSTVPNLATWFAISVDIFPLRLREMLGDLGWLDTPQPLLLLLVVVAAWIWMLVRLPSIRRSAIVCGVLGIVIVPSAIEALGWGALPSWWQGRYTLPFAAGFVLLLLLRSGRYVPRRISIVSGVSLLSLGIMVWVNAVRYGYGLSAFPFPASLAQPAISPVGLGLSAAVSLILVAASGYLIVRALRLKPDLRGPKPEMVSTDPWPLR
jgi:hypothetical protein